MSLISKFATVGGATLISRIFGFAREMMMASALGVSPVADAFNLAFRFPNLFRRFFAEGALNSAFVPLFSRALEQEGEAGARRFATEIFSTLTLVLFALTVPAIIFMPFLVRTIIAPGLNLCIDEAALPQALSCAERFDITVTFSRIMFPYLASMSLVAMIGGILNAYRRFFAAAAAPALLNLFLIAILAWCLWRQEDTRMLGFMMSWGVLAAGVAQFAMVAIAMRMAGFSLGLQRPRWTPGLKRLLVLAGPAALIGGITQINLFVGQAVASFKEGAVSILTYADRPYQLPLGMVGVAIGVVLLPELSRALKGGRIAEAQHTQNRSLEFALFLTLPAAVALFIMPEPIVRLIYERGAFGPDTTRAVAAVLGIYALGLPAFVLIRVFSPGYFAREDTRRPMFVTLASAIVNTVLSVALFFLLAERGIAMATTLAGWMNALLLFHGLYARGHWVVDRALLRRCAMLLVSSLIMGAVILFAMPYARAFAQTHGTLGQIGGLIALIALAMIAYFGAALVTGAADRAMVLRILKLRAGRRGA